MTIGGMTHKGEQLRREIERLKRELQTPIDPKRRIAVQQAINQLEQNKRSWESPH